MRAVCSKGFLLIAATILLSCSHRAGAETPATHSAKSWLDHAVSEKRCPLSPVNVGAGFPENHGDGLLSRITVSGHTLQINGTDDPDHIVVRAANQPGFLRVRWNGTDLGRFGPVTDLVLQGNGGDDVLIVKSDVTLPATLDGGDGDDCLQGGSGGDQLLGGAGDDVLVAGTGRPALVGGSGSDRVVIPQSMGTLRYAPGADSAVVQLLGQIYDLEPLSNDPGSSSNATPGPILLGSADLGDEQLVSAMQQAHGAGHSVVLTNGTRTDSENLRLTLSHPNVGIPAHDLSAASGTIALTSFRATPRPGGQVVDYRAGNFLSLPDSLDDWTTQLLSQVFSANAVLPRAPGDGSGNDLQKLANSYTSHIVKSDKDGNGVQILNSVWAVRSFQNKADYYYVQQEADYYIGKSPEAFFDWESGVNSDLAGFVKSAAIGTSPASTECTTSTTSGTSWNVGGSAGWQNGKGLNAALTGGVTVSNSTTVTCPQIKIQNKSKPDGETQWLFANSASPSGAQLESYLTQWIWQVNFSDYNPGQESLTFHSFAHESGTRVFRPIVPVSVDLELISTLPIPFGQTQTLQNPAVVSVNPTCVNAGNVFGITGTGFYPSLVTSVLIDGSPVPTTQFTAASDTLINVVAPAHSGESLPIAVQTGQGISNANVTIEISTIDLCGAAAVKKK